MAAGGLLRIEVSQAALMIVPSAPSMNSANTFERTSGSAMPRMAIKAAFFAWSACGQCSEAIW